MNKKTIYKFVYSYLVLIAGTVLVISFFMNKALVPGIVLLLIMFGGIGYFLFRSIDSSISKIEETASAIADGNFSKRIDVARSGEFKDLAAAVNKMADKLQREMDKLEEMSRIRTDFVANVSHELRTPLTAVKGFLETLEDGALEDKENALRFLAIIKKHTERLSTLLDDLLNLAEIEDVRSGFDVSSCDLKSLVDEIVWHFDSGASEKEQKLDVSYNGNEFLMQGDKSKIERVLINLVDNAIKYTPRKGHIQISLFEQDDNIMFKVEDDGIGIPEEHLGRIFERFYRVDKARSRELGGTGLGLSIVKHIVVIHKGHIDIESEVGKGTKILVVFPKGKVDG